MTRIEYELLREQHPGLELPPWELMCSRCQTDVDYVEAHTREEVIASRASNLMTKGFGRGFYASTRIVSPPHCV